MVSGKRLNLLFILLLVCNIPLLSQALTKRQYIKAVQDADVNFYYNQDYLKAASQFEYLVNLYPQNQNLAAKLGICYLNIDGKENEALNLLNKASSNVVNTDKEYVEYGEKAPLDTYMYRAIAYHRNDSLQKAILLYTDVKKKLGSTEVFRVDYIDKQIADCRYAMEMEKNPVNVRSELFIPWLTDYPGASSPVLAKDDSVFIFTIPGNDKNRIMCSYKTNSWKKPIEITKQLGGFSGMVSNSITGNGKLLVVYLDDGGDGNIYFSKRIDSTWTKLKNFGKPINTIYWEAHAFITPDGNTLYFSSNRPGGAGELDIWTSERNKNGSWNEPENCGRVINSPYNDNTPYFDPFSKSILFSSEGHSSMGSFDIFQSVRTNGKWTTPIGLPYRINTTGENTFLISGSKDLGYLTSIYNRETGSRNIYSLIPSDENISDNRIRTNGQVSLGDGMPIDLAPTRIQLFDQKTGLLLKDITISDSSSFNYAMKPGQFKILISKIGPKNQKTDTINLNIEKEKKSKTNPLKDTALYKFEIKPGDYQIFINHVGYKTDTINISIPSEFPGNFISINSALTNNRVFNGDFLDIQNILFEYNSYKLTDKAKSTLELLKSILLNFKNLKIEVAGYTDSKGSSDYNYKLADTRAQTIIDFLAASGVSGDRFIKKAYGSSNFIALNSFPDGTDNPEGRKYNRRVTFGIINPKTGVTIHNDTYLPAQLKQPNLLKYSIILLKTDKNLPEGYFKKLLTDEFHLIRSVKTETGTLYIIEIFNNKTEATSFLTYVRERGFSDAYIVTQNEIHGMESGASEIQESAIPQDVSGKRYTIQLSASKVKLNMNDFTGIDGIRELSSEDGYYRYIYGEYNTLSQAKSELERIHDLGYKAAYLRDLKTLIK